MAKWWRTCFDLCANLISTKVSASHCKSRQVHTRPGQTELQVDPSFQLVFTCDSVWRGLESIFFDKRDLSFMSCTAIASKFKMHWFPNEGCYWAGKLVPLMYQSNRSLNIPPGQPPGHLNFWNIFVQNPPSRGRKAVQMPHHRSIPGDQMPQPPGNFSVAFIMLQKLCM